MEDRMRLRDSSLSIAFTGVLEFGVGAITRLLPPGATAATGIAYSVTNHTGAVHGLALSAVLADEVTANSPEIPTQQRLERLLLEVL
jgi:hypothetical protein